jgi:hypothetical protein
MTPDTAAYGRIAYEAYWTLVADGHIPGDFDEIDVDEREGWAAAHNAAVDAALTEEREHGVTPDLVAECHQLAARIGELEGAITGVLGQRDHVEHERDKLQRACETLGRVVVGQARDLYAMWIDVSRGDMDAVRERVLNTIPDVDDNEPDEQWNGTETGGEWFWRTKEQS